MGFGVTLTKSGSESGSEWGRPPTGRIQAVSVISERATLSALLITFCLVLLFTV